MNPVDVLPADDDSGMYDQQYGRMEPIGDDGHYVGVHCHHCIRCDAAKIVSCNDDRYYPSGAFAQ